MTIAQSHARLDAMMATVAEQASALGKPITCRGTGCFGCCKEPVLATRAEVEHLVAGLSPEERAAILPRLARWIAQVRTSGLLADPEPHVYLWRMMRAWCPLLEDGRCVAYGRRPAACRMHVVSGDPAACFDDERRKTQVHLLCDATQGQSMADALEETGAMELDHLGIFLAELLAGKKLASAAHWTVRGHVKDETTLVLNCDDRPARGGVRIATAIAASHAPR